MNEDLKALREFIAEAGHHRDVIGGTFRDLWWDAEAALERLSAPGGEWAAMKREQWSIGYSQAREQAARLCDDRASIRMSLSAASTCSDARNSEIGKADAHSLDASTIRAMEPDTNN